MGGGRTEGERWREEEALGTYVYMCVGGTLGVGVRDLSSGERG